MQPFERRRVNRIEDGDGSFGREQNAAGTDRPVRDAGGRMEAAERGQQLEEQAERRVESRGQRRVGGDVEGVRHAQSADEVGHDAQPAVVIRFETARAREALVLERREPGDRLLEDLLEGDEFGPHAQPLEDFAALAVEREHTPAKTVGIAGRGHGGGGLGRLHGHEENPDDFATRAPVPLGEIACDIA